MCCVGAVVTGDFCMFSVDGWFWTGQGVAALTVRHHLPKLHSLTVTALMMLVESNLLCSLSFDLTCKVCDPVTGYVS